MAIIVTGCAIVTGMVGTYLSTTPCCNASNWIGRLLCMAMISLGSVPWVIGCNDAAPPPPSCSGVDIRDCKAKSGCFGKQACNADGTWGSCTCDSGAERPLLGGSCSSDSTCPSGATCLLPNSTAWLGGGPPNGLCVADCSSSLDICATYGNAVCVASDLFSDASPRHALCMPKCDLTTGTSELAACAAVPSAVCEALDLGNAGYCRPICRFDSDCPSGHCDRVSSVCVAQPRPAPPKSFGQSCEKGTGDCNGICVDLSTNELKVKGICSNRCRTDILTECAVEGASPMAGVCSYAATYAKAGDIGYCAPLCDCNDQCLATGFLCRAFSALDTQTALKRSGMCVPAQSGEAGIACIEGS